MPNRNLLVFNKIKQTKCPHVVLIDSDLLNNIQDFIKVKLFNFLFQKKKKESKNYVYYKRMQTQLFVQFVQQQLK
jgi:hypothetical protein